jgi:hypothetical protein
MSSDPPAQRKRKPGKRALAAERKWSEPAILDALEAEPLAAFRLALDALSDPPDGSEVRRVAGLLPALNLPPTIAGAVQSVGRAIVAWRRRHGLPVSADAHAWQHLEQAALIGPGIIGRDVHLDVLPPFQGRHPDSNLDPDPDLADPMHPEFQLFAVTRKRQKALERIHAEEQEQTDKPEDLHKTRVAAGATGGRASATRRANARRCKVTAIVLTDWNARAEAIHKGNATLSVREIAECIAEATGAKPETVRKRIACPWVSKQMELPPHLAKKKRSVARGIN